MSKILITGAAGFAGRHIVSALLSLGNEVHAVDNLAPHTGAIDPGHGWPLFEPRDYKAFHFYKEDCRSWFAKNGEVGFDSAFHLAAIVGGRLTIENNPIAVADDLSIDAAFWQWARTARPKKCVYLSSSAAYPIKFQQRDDYTLLKEEMISFSADIGMPDLSYGWSKLTGEYLARLAFERHGLESAVYRPFSGYGEDQDDAYPFPSICKRVIKEASLPSLRVWGSGLQMRDFIHIDDCVKGILATMTVLNNGSALNLSTGRFTSFIEFATIAANQLGLHPIITGTSDKPEGVFARAGDTTKQKQLGFNPTISLEDGINKCLRYFQNRRI